MYNQSEIFEQSKQLIEEHNLYFIEDVVAYLPISKSTFYTFFTKESYEMETLKEMLTRNKVSTKVAIRKQMQESQNPSNLIALYKLLATDTEFAKLTNNETRSNDNHTITIVHRND